MYALLLRVSCRAIGVQLSCGEIFVKDFEIRIALQYARINWRKHISLVSLSSSYDGSESAVWREAGRHAWERRSYLLNRLASWPVHRAKIVVKLPTPLTPFIRDFIGHNALPEGIGGDDSSAQPNVR
jgi:hypothetical protein